MRIVRRPLENSRDWICRLSAKPEPASSHFLSWGERIKGEGGRKTQIKFPHFLLKECILLDTTINRQTFE
jgi:hypothetical protein